MAGYFADAIGTPTVHSHASTEGGHVDLRHLRVTTDIAWFEDRAEWKGLKSFVMRKGEREGWQDSAKPRLLFVLFR